MDGAPLGLKGLLHFPAPCLSLHEDLPGCLEASRPCLLSNLGTGSLSGEDRAGNAAFPPHWLVRASRPRHQLLRALTAAASPGD